jgi:hypothetical protein
MVHTIPNDKDLSILPSKPNLDQYQGIPITYSMVGLKIAVILLQEVNCQESGALNDSMRRRTTRIIKLCQ